MPEDSNSNEIDIATIITPLRICRALDRITSQLSLQQQKLVSQQQMSLFHAKTRPTFPLLDYIYRIKEHSACDADDFAYCSIIVIIYLDKYIHATKNALTGYNIHRLLATAYLLTFKQHCDERYNNKYFAYVAGMPTSQLNGLEIEFLKNINFSLHVRLAIFCKYKEEFLKTNKSTDEPSAMEISPSR
ncbi:MAG: hypothetical protein P1U40_00915 [Coxiellaceae bacterium]|nr:hypothetical protein [Coxiellaceae bacterium]